MRTVVALVAFVAAGIFGVSRAEPPSPDSISAQFVHFGQPILTWSVERDRKGSYGQGADTVTFFVSVDEFDRVRAVLKPHESDGFTCTPAIAKMPRADIKWSRGGQELHRINFDTGCMTPQGQALFKRLEQADVLLQAMRARAMRGSN